MTILKAGDTAPAFSLPDQDGRATASKDLVGSRYVLYFYPADDTPGCTIEACAFNENLEAFQSAKVPVLGVSPDGAESHERFRSKFGLRFSLLSDPTKGTLEAYGAWGERPGRGLGVIRSTFLVGADGAIQRAWYFVTAQGHAEEVLEALGA